MDSKRLAGLLAIWAFLISTPARARESLVAYKSLTPEIARPWISPVLRSRIAGNVAIRRLWPSSIASA